jgi:TrmH family RNA methyltransferase
MKLDDIRKLHQKKYRAEFQHFIVEGEHLILELEKASKNNSALKNCELFVTGAYAHWQGPFVKHRVSEKQMAQISDTKTPQGIVAVVPFLPEWDTATGTGKAIYLHEVQDPGNLGTILRTLAWFGNFVCLLSPGSVDPYNPKVVRSSMGAIFHVPLELEVPIGSLVSRFQRIAYLDMTGSQMKNPEFKGFDCYLFGNEARGVPGNYLAELNARPFTIAGCGAIESLNLASVVNMCVYEISR